GDGTLHEALPALAEADLPFALLPFGRGNDFARNSGMPTRIGRAWPAGRALDVRRVDLPSVNGALFGSVACLGFDAAVNRLARGGGGFLGGTAGYIVCVLRALASFRPFEAEIDLDGAVWSGPVMMIAVANGPCYGGGMRIAPGARMDDGLLDVCVVGRMSSLSLARQFPRVFAGTHVRHPSVRMQWARRVRIETDRRREIWADGELAGETPARLEIGSRSLRVLVPSRAVGVRPHGEEAAA
ncbi:MAG TPA: YegS/Rv2252/BmrU family lipid kinase, partial [Candidatus Eisenbacteria bacterium]